MKKVHIWLSIISLIFTVSWVNAQEVAEENNTRETLKAEEVIDSLQKREKKANTQESYRFSIYIFFGMCVVCEAVCLYVYVCLFVCPSVCLSPNLADCLPI